MKEKIKQLTEILEELGKLFDVASTLIAKFTLFVMGIITLLQIIRGG